MAADVGSILAGGPKKIHFVGVGGSGMYPLVQIVLAAGHAVSGSDVNEGTILDYERRAGVRVIMGQRAENVHGADLVVYSAAIRPDNPERLEAERQGIPCVERSVMLGHVSGLYARPLCIAGTHGKTTTTGMAVQILEMAGFDPGAVIGGRLPLIGGYGKAGAIAEGWPRAISENCSCKEAKQPEPDALRSPLRVLSNGREAPAAGGAVAEQWRGAAEHCEPDAGYGHPGRGAPEPLRAAGGAVAEGWPDTNETPSGNNGGIIAIEADEYHNTFHELSVDIAVLLNVDDDHLEFFGSMDNLKKAFRKFCALAKSAVVYNGDDDNSRQVVADLSQRLVSFGLGEGCDYRATGLKQHKPARWAFTVLRGGEALGEVALAAPGRHNVYNALAALAGAMLLGASFAQCAAGLAAFTGTGRRFEVLGKTRGFTVMDDYAHHPTELRATLTAAKEMGYGTVWAVFQPYTYSRTQLLLDDFAEVLPIADRVVMTAIMGGRERAQDHSVTTADLAAKIPGSLWFETQRQVADYILENAQPGDLVLTLGCGDIYKCAHMLVDAGKDEAR